MVLSTCCFVERNALVMFFAVLSMILVASRASALLSVPSLLAQIFRLLTDVTPDKSSTHLTLLYEQYILA